MEDQLASERERFEKQLAAESARTQDQLDHDRYLARRAEASTTVEEISRLVSQHVVCVYDYFQVRIKGIEPKKEEFQVLNRQVDQLREEISIVAIRFGNKSPLVTKLIELLEGVSAQLPTAEEANADDGKKKELKEFLLDLNRLQAAFVIEAKKALDNY